MTLDLVALHLAGSSFSNVKKEDRPSKAHLGDYSAIMKYELREYATKTK